MGYKTINFAIADGVATITLARPDQGNAIDGVLARELLHAAIRCDQEPEIRAALLTGEGRMFCVGGNLREFAGADDDRVGALVLESVTYLHGAVSRLARMQVPLVVAVNGPAAGAGMSLAALGDLVLAARSAHFTSAYTAAGLSPDGSLSYLLPRLVGLRRAQELILTNRRLSAAEAADWGLVTRVVDDSDLDLQARTLAESVAAGPTGALVSARALLLESYSATMEEQMENEARAIATAAASSDGREGVHAFLDKRRPVYGNGRKP